MTLIHRDARVLYRHFSSRYCRSQNWPLLRIALTSGSVHVKQRQRPHRQSRMVAPASGFTRASLLHSRGTWKRQNNARGVSVPPTRPGPSAIDTRF